MSVHLTPQKPTLGGDPNAANPINARSPNKVVIDIAQGPAGLSTPIRSTDASPSSSTSASSPLLHGGSSSSLPFETEDPSASWARRHIVHPFKRRILQPALAILKSGATPEGLALSIAFGLTGGNFPIPMTTTVICVAFAFIFKLNLAAVQLVNLMLTPVNFATFLSFVRWGEWIFGATPVVLSLDLFKSSPLDALRQFWVSLLYGVVAWGIFTPPATLMAYMALKPVMRRAMAGMGISPQTKSAAD